MTEHSTGRVYRTGFERVYDCPSGRRILDRLTPRTDREHHQPAQPMTDGPVKETG